MINIPLFTGCHTRQVVQDFFHQQYHLAGTKVLCRTVPAKKFCCCSFLVLALFWCGLSFKSERKRNLVLISQTKKSRERKNMQNRGPHNAAFWIKKCVSEKKSKNDAWVWMYQNFMECCYFGSVPFWKANCLAPLQSKTTSSFSAAPCRQGGMFAISFFWQARHVWSERDWWS